MPAGFATIERAPYGPQLEFTQYDIDQGDVIIKTNEHWPGHDLAFEFLVQDPQGTTIDPYQFTIKSPKMHIKQSESKEIDLLALGVEEDALYDPDAFILLKKSPHYGEIHIDGTKLEEEDSTGTDAILTYIPKAEHQLSEDFFTISFPSILLHLKPDNLIKKNLMY